MLTRVQAIAAALLLGVLASGGCSSAAKSNDTTAAGASGTGGNSASGASGGSVGHAGMGSAGETGGGGTAGGTAGTNGAGAGAGAADTSSEGGAGGEAGGNTSASCPSGLYLPSGECVACLASNDQCPAGQYCGDSNTCLAGCKDATSCASGVCGVSHDCQNCISDQECAAGRVCGDKQCALPCSEAEEGGGAGCGAGLTCCSLHCINEQSDSAHCGACGTLCGATSFCGTAACHDLTLANLCTVGKVAVVLDGQAGDEVPGRAIGAALAAKCTPTPTLREVSQTLADVENTSSGRPVSGGDELLVVSGGFFFERVADYSEAQRIAPIYAQAEGQTFEYRSRATGKIVVSFPGVEDASSYSFVIQLMRDPSSGSLMLNTQGFWPRSTATAASYFTDQLLPQLATLTKAWYVYSWTDANADQKADLSEIALVDSGP